MGASIWTQTHNIYNTHISIEQLAVHETLIVDTDSKRQTQQHMCRLQILRPWCIRLPSRKFLRRHQKNISFRMKKIARRLASSFRKHSLPIGMIYQPIRVEEEAGVHGSLGNVTMEKSENWPENTIVTLNLWILQAGTLLQATYDLFCLSPQSCCWLGRCCT